MAQSRSNTKDKQFPPQNFNSLRLCTPDGSSRPSFNTRIGEFAPDVTPSRPVRMLIDLFEGRCKEHVSPSSQREVRPETIILFEEWTEDQCTKCVQDYDDLVKSLCDNDGITEELLCVVGSTLANTICVSAKPSSSSSCVTEYSRESDDTEGLKNAVDTESPHPFHMSGKDKKYCGGEGLDCGKSFERHILREIVKNLECPVCMELFRPPVAVCRQGHSICGPCFKRLKRAKCPICHGGYRGCRNRVVEDAVSTLQFLCKCDCQKSLFFENDEDHHESYCKSRKVSCPVLDCSMEVVLDQIYCHILEDHVDVQLVYAVRHSQASTVKWLWNTTLLPGQTTRVVLDVKKYGVFLLQASTDEKKKTRSVWLQQLPVVSQLSGFFCLVTLFSPSQLKKVAFQAVVSTEQFVCSEENACAILTDEIDSTLECGIQLFRVIQP